MFALENSLIVAVTVTVVATALGTLAAYGLTRADFPGKPLVFGLLISPLAVPLVITALGLYFFFARIGLVQDSYRADRRACRAGSTLRRHHGVRDP